MFSDCAGARNIPEHGPVNTSMYFPLHLINQPESVLDMFKHTNLSLFPGSQPEVPFVVSASNRGHTFHLMHNPYHRQELSAYGLRPETAFMCGWFAICSPNAKVQELYQNYWEALREPGAFRIGINARLGDAVFTQQNEDLGDAQLALAAPYFTCAEKLEKAYAVPGQKVLWYFMADALPLRKAAKLKYGSKLLTDIATVTQHPDCRKHNPASCNKEAMDLSIQHSLGQLFTYSLADFHIMPQDSGFGRLGAWMSGRYDNIFEFNLLPPPDLHIVCDPKQPTAHAVSAQTGALV